MMRRRIVIVVKPENINKNRFPPNDDPENTRIEMDENVRMKHPFRPFGEKKSFWQQLKEAFGRK